jgi:phosphopantothenoylcysteine synthetase/decarboxylase
MLRVCQQVANDTQPNVWIHAAAVLDYYTEAEEGKKSSGIDNWSLDLTPGPKHIAELASLVEGATRIGFKLESDVTPDTLIELAREQIERYGVNAVIANIMEEMNDPDEIRARVVHADGTVDEVSDDRALCEAINGLIKG